MKKTETAVMYYSNNSGGRWWLTDENWKALETNGWVVAWAANYKGNKDGRYMGALATYAFHKEIDIEVARIDFQNITGLDPWEMGCQCCGQPHYFSVIEEKEITDWLKILNG